MSRKDGILGTIVATISAFVADIVFYSGDLLVGFAVYLVTDIGLFVSFTSYLSRVADSIAWLPAASVENAYYALVVLGVLVLGARIVRGWYERRKDK